MAQQFPGFSFVARAGTWLIVMAALSVARAAPCAGSPKRDSSQAVSAATRGPEKNAPKLASRTGLQLDVALASGAGTGGGSEQMAAVSRLAGTVVGSMMALGYRWDTWFVGATVLGALGNPRPDPAVDVCSVEGMVCQAQLFRYGLQARYYYSLPKSAVTPWVGMGIERELFQLVNASRAPDAVYAQGNQFDVRFGLDIATKQSAMQGSFFVDYALGGFEGGTVLTTRVRALDDVRALHHWILLGGGLSWRP